MKNTRTFTIVILIASMAGLACASLTPPNPLQQVRENEATETPAESFSTIPVPSSTTDQLQLEIVQSQIWQDRYGNVRANVLFRNPYDFPVAPKFQGSSVLRNSAQEIIQVGNLYFLDGISGGAGFILPGETIAANTCFNCEEAPVTEWSTAQYDVVIGDASGSWNYYTDVEATVVVSFDGKGPLFFIDGTVKNNTDTTLSIISARVLVFDQKGNLVGAGTGSAWNVAPGTSASIQGGVGQGQAPDGPVKYEVTALGVKY